MPNTKSNANTMLCDVMEHYKNLLQPNQIISPCFPSKNNGIVNIGINYENLLKSPFTIDEIKNAVKSLKINKSPVLDSITSEMIKCTNDKIFAQITKLLNEILDSGICTKTWGYGLIEPIFKQDNKAEPANYRLLTIA